MNETWDDVNGGWRTIIFIVILIILTVIMVVKKRKLFSLWAFWNLGFFPPFTLYVFFDIKCIFLIGIICSLGFESILCISLMCYFIFHNLFIIDPKLHNMDLTSYGLWTNTNLFKPNQYVIWIDILIEWSLSSVEPTN